MTDREQEAFDAAIHAVTGAAIDMSRPHPAVVREQSTDGTVGVDIVEGGPLPRASGVAPVYGLPATRCTFNPSAEPQGRLEFDNGDPRKRTLGNFDSHTSGQPMPVSEINIADATANQDAARRGDPAGGGSLVWVQNPPGPGGVPTGGTLTYTPFPSVSNPNPTPTVWLAVGIITITQVSPPSATPTMTFSGAIDGGSSIVKIGG
jgi:hypothetical protein